MTTFSMDAAKTGLRQRIGYFGSDNGYYLERSSRTSTGVCLVRRSKVSGIVDEVSVDQAERNVDKLDGNGPSHLTLNLDNPQILFLDMEWLGVGSVRIGFVINGELIVESCVLTDSTEHNLRLTDGTSGRVNIGIVVFHINREFDSMSSAVMVELPPVSASFIC